MWRRTVIRISRSNLRSKVQLSLLFLPDQKVSSWQYNCNAIAMHPSPRKGAARPTQFQKQILCVMCSKAAPFEKWLCKDWLYVAPFCVLGGRTTTSNQKANKKHHFCVGLWHGGGSNIVFKDMGFCGFNSGKCIVLTRRRSRVDRTEVNRPAPAASQRARKQPSKGATGASKQTSIRIRFRLHICFRARIWTKSGKQARQHATGQVNKQTCK